MATHHSADARTALMATYIARHANPASMRSTSAAACSGGSRAWDGKKGERGSTEGLGGSFGARGRTIYNADRYRVRETRSRGKPKCGTLRELERIDAEEERRRRYGEQFLMAARGDVEEEEEEERMDVDVVATADEMFALYIHI